MSGSPGLVAALFRFEAAEVVRARSTYLISLLALLAVLGLVAAVTGRNGSGAPPLAFIVGHWAIAAPLCRSWLEQDVVDGYASLWLQKPITVLGFYSARLVALLLWSLIASIAVCLAAAPGYALAGAWWQVGHLAVGSGWIPPLLVVLSFFGSGLGSGGLFAYGVLFAAFALRGLADSLRLGPVYELVSFALPPVDGVLNTAATARAVEVEAALRGLWPLLAYGLVCAGLGLWLSRRVPSRLSRAG